MGLRLPLVPHLQSAAAKGCLLPFVKLDCGVLESSLWSEAAEVRVVFITMLAMCSSDGMCASTAPGIARRAHLPLAAVERALKKLQAPDPHSRTLADEGRRIRRVDGGFLVVNYLRYREKDHTATERKRRQREAERQRREASRRDTVTSRGTSREVTQGEAEGEGEGEAEGERETTTSSSSSREAFVDQVVAAWRAAFPHRRGRVTTADSSAVETALAVFDVETIVGALTEMPHHPERLRDKNGRRYEGLAALLKYPDRVDEMAAEHRARALPPPGSESARDYYLRLEADDKARHGHNSDPWELPAGLSAESAVDDGDAVKWFGARGSFGVVIRNVDAWLVTNRAEGEDLQPALERWAAENQAPPSAIVALHDHYTRPRRAAR